MKRLFATTLLALCTMTACAQTTRVHFSLQRLTGSPNNRQITLKLPDQVNASAAAPFVWHTNIVFGTPMILQPTNGEAYVDVVPSNYIVQLDGLPTPMLMPVPYSTNVLEAVNLIAWGAHFQFWADPNLFDPAGAAASHTNANWATNMPVGGHLAAATIIGGTSNFGLQVGNNPVGLLFRDDLDEIQIHGNVRWDGVAYGEIDPDSFSAGTNIAIEADTSGPKLKIKISSTGGGSSAMATNAVTAGYATNAGTAAFATNADSASTAANAAYATNAGSASTAAFATSAGSASTAANATSADSASTAAYATVAGALTGVGPGVFELLDVNSNKVVTAYGTNPVVAAAGGFVGPTLSGQAAFVKDIATNKLPASAITNPPWLQPTNSGFQSTTGNVTGNLFAGRLGIGTTFLPTSGKVQIWQTNGGSFLDFFNSDTFKTWDLHPSGDDLRLFEFAGGSSSGGDQVTFRAGGNVGIGTNTPQARLDVAGNIHGSGDLQVDGHVYSVDGLLGPGGGGGSASYATNSGYVGDISTNKIPAAAVTNAPWLLPTNLSNLVLVGPGFATTTTPDGTTYVTNNAIQSATIFTVQTPGGLYSGSTVSSNATPAPIIAFAVSNNWSAVIKGTFLFAMPTNPLSTSWNKEATFRNEAGTLSLISSNFLDHGPATGWAATNFDAYYGINGTNIVACGVGDTNAITALAWQGQVIMLTNGFFNLHQPPTIWLNSTNLPSAGSVVTTWSDSSGNGYNFTNAVTAYKPGVSNGPNGQLVAKFNGTSNQLFAAASAVSLLTGKASATIMLACQPMVTNVNADVFHISVGGANGGRSYNGTLSSGLWQTSNRRLDGDSSAVVTLNPVTTNAMWIYTMKLDPGGAGNVTLSTNNVAVGSTAYATTGNWATDSLYLSLGSGGHQFFFGGYVGELLVFVPALSSTDLAYWNGYVKTKFATP